MLSWNHCFDDPWESAWGACHRLAWLNTCTVREAIEAMVGRRVELAGIRQALFADDGQWWSETFLDSNAEGQAIFASLRARYGREGAVSQWQRVVAPLRDVQVRFCPRCLRAGFHSVLFQLAGLDRCPWHGSRLCTECEACHRPFVDLRDVAVGGFSCPHCGACAVPASWPLHVTAGLRRRRTEVQRQLTSWARSAIEANTLDAEWGVNPIGVREGRRLLPRSWPAVLLPMLARHTPFPLEERLICAAPTQLQSTDPHRFGRFRTDALWVDIDRIFDEVAKQVKHYMGTHIACYERAKFMLSATCVIEDTLVWQGEVCVKAWAYFVWRTRCRHMIHESKKWLRHGQRLVEHVSLDALHQDMLSSFHHGLQIAVMSRSMLAHGVELPDRGLVDLWDPWLWLSDSGALRGFAYGPAEPLDVASCDHGRVASRWEHPMALLRREQKQERARAGPKGLGVWGPRTSAVRGPRGIGPKPRSFTWPDDGTL